MLHVPVASVHGFEANWPVLSLDFQETVPDGE